MPSLNTLVFAQIKKIPVFALAKVIKRQLIEQGIEENVEDLAIAMAEHVSTGNKGKFSWDDGRDGPDLQLNIKITVTDIKEIKETINKKIDGVPELMGDIVQKAARKKARQMIKEWPYYHAEEDATFSLFRANLQIRWGKGIDALKMLLMAGREIGGNSHNALMRSKAKRNQIKREVLILLHARACQTMSEIVLLLENGYSDGALTRWRTLYELSVVMELIAEGDDDLAERFLNHRCISHKKEMELANKHSEPFDEETTKTVDEDYTEVIQLYGSDFRNDYGWASKKLGEKNPRFGSLERAAKMKELPPEYKLASYKVHAGAIGATWSLGQLQDGPFPISGATDVGLEMPACQAAFSFTRMTSLLIINSRKMENQISINAFINIRDYTTKQFLKSAKKIRKEIAN